MPDVEIDIDDLLDAANEEERALKLQVSLIFKRFGRMAQNPTLIQAICLLGHLFNVWRAD